MQCCSTLSPAFRRMKPLQVGEDLDLRRSGSTLWTIFINVHQSSMANDVLKLNKLKKNAHIVKGTVQTFGIVAEL